MEKRAGIQEFSEWLPIPGYPDYEVNTLRPAIRSLKRWRKTEPVKYLKLAGRNKSTVLYNKGGHLSIAWNKACFCATNGIMPELLSESKIHCVVTGNGIIPFTHQDFLVEIQALRHNRPVYSREEILPLYQKEKDYVDSVVQFLKSGDGAKMAQILYSYKDQVCEYMERTLAVTNSELLEEAFGSAVDVTLERIKTEAVINPYSHLKKLAKCYIYHVRRKRRKGHITIKQRKECV